MRATCDTNVLARAAVRPTGPARAVFVELLSDPHAHVLSEPIVTELARVLRYDRVRNQSQMTDAEIDSFVNDLRELAELVTIPDSAPPVANDPDDDLVVATAVAGRADVICTRDRHIRHNVVRAYCATFGIRVLTDVELLNELRAGR
ncbi:MAG TPA: putative toxin-antitoxin system toxin component, PIN family [Pirellulales bacterium]|nr:putative toxin-antitoxin system toxin component, PIN family [Pirellulales bacterium]